MSINWRPQLFDSDMKVFAKIIWDRVLLTLYVGNSSSILVQMWIVVVYLYCVHVVLACPVSRIIFFV